MKYRLEFELTGLPKNPNGSHGHWRTAAGIRKKWRSLTHNMILSWHKRPAAPLKKCSIECIRFSTRPSDYDNLVASFKPIIDGLKDAKVIEDDNETVVVERRYRNETAKPKQGKVRIIVEEI